MGATNKMAMPVMLRTSDGRCERQTGVPRNVQDHCEEGAQHRA
jgi:hypothetical protein